MYKFTEILNKGKGSWTIGHFSTNSYGVVTPNCEQLPSRRLVAPYLTRDGKPVTKFALPILNWEKVDFSNSIALERITTRKLTENEKVRGNVSENGVHSRIELCLPTKNLNHIGESFLRYQDISTPLSFSGMGKLHTIGAYSFNGFTGNSLVDNEGVATLSFRNCTHLSYIEEFAFSSLFGEAFTGKEAVLDFYGVEREVSISKDAGFEKVDKIILPDERRCASAIISGIMGNHKFTQLTVIFRGRTLQYNSTPNFVPEEMTPNHKITDSQIISDLVKIDSDDVYLKRISELLEECNKNAEPVDTAEELEEKVMEATKKTENHTIFTYSDDPIGYSYVVRYNPKNLRYEAVIIGFCGATSSNVSIPAKIKDTSIYITMVGDGAFCGVTGIKKISYLALTEDMQLRIVGNSAFKGHECSDIMMCNWCNLKVVGEYAFYSRGDEYTLTLPDSLENIGEYAFSGAYGESKFGWAIKLPKFLKRIGRNAFYMYTKTEVNVDVSGVSCHCEFQEDSLAGTVLMRSKFRDKLKYMVRYPENQRASAMTKEYAEKFLAIVDIRRQSANRKGPWEQQQREHFMEQYELELLRKEMWELENILDEVLCEDGNFG